MKKILFPTDFSDTANHAYLYALQVADKIDAEIITIHAYRQPDLSDVHLPNTVREVYESIELDEFENYRSQIPKLHEIARDNGYENVVTRHSLIEGDPVRCAVRTAKKEEVDFVIMGTNGAGFLEEIFLGSVAGEVLENSPVPVLAVPKDAKFDGKIDRFVFMTSYKEEEEVALEQLASFAAWFDAHIHVVNVDLNNTELYKRQMIDLKNKFASESRLSFHVVEGEELLPAVTDFAKEHNVDLISLVSHQRNFFQELFRFSHAKKLSYHSEIPVMSLPAKMLA